MNAVITFFLFFPVFYFLLKKESRFPQVFKTKKIWGHFLLYPVLIFYRIKYQSVLDRNQAYVFCPNHTSYLDIILIYIALPVYFHSMGKAELLKVPFFRRFFQKMNIPVNRKSNLDSHRAYTRAANDIDKGISIALFPEGTIHHNGPVMGRLKNGPFRLAIEKQIPIVPITFLNNWILLPDDIHRRIGRPGIAEVVIHEPVSTTGMTEADIEKLKSLVRTAIDKPLKENFKEFFPAP